jgi:hypothetical protein
MIASGHVRLLPKHYVALSQAIGGMVFGMGAALEEAMMLDPRFGYFVTISPNTTRRYVPTFPPSMPFFWPSWMTNPTR